jgi:sugar phosphate isomerase/epimerase
MQRILSTYLFVSKKLTPELLTVIHQNKFQAVEVFASRHHFDYANRAEVRSLAQALADNRLILNSLHAPTNRDVALNREGGTPLSITEVERVRRIEAMDELRRVIDVAEDLPFSRLIVHMGGSRETGDPRKRDAAFSTLEHLSLHAKQVGVTICIENTTSEMGMPSYLKAFVEETRLNLKFNFDIGHAHLLDGAEDERVARGFEVLRDSVVSTHIHDNHGEKDEHLLPYDGSIDWAAALKMFREAPVKDLPLTLEIKEKSGPDAPGLAEQIAAVAKVVDRLEEAWLGSQL